MKNIFALLAVLVLVSILSCSSEPTDGGTPSNGSISKSSSSESNDGNTSSSGTMAKSSSSNGSSNNSSGNGSYGSQAAENGQVYKYEDDKKYTHGGLKIYMAEERDKNGNLILTEETMLEVGTMSNGEVSLALPPKVDSRFLIKIDEAPFGMEVKPLGVEAWFYIGPLRLIDNSGKHIGNLRYYKKASDTEYHYVDYCYFSENAKINGIVSEEGEYRIDAKKGWNKVYLRVKHIADQSIEPYFTTDLSEVPGGLKWIVEEFD